jgi:putative nucleotidyltransferase with HDIG domain
MEKIKLSEFTIEKIKNREFEKSIPELYELEKVIQNNPWHDNDPVFNHTLSVVSELNALFEITSDKIKQRLDIKIQNYSIKELLILAAVFHDIGKKEALKEALYLDHEKIGAEKLRNILPRFDLTEKEREFVIKIVANHDFIHANSRLKDADTKWLEFKKQNPDIFIEVALLAKADLLGGQLKNNMPEEFEFRMGFVDKIIESY